MQPVYANAQEQMEAELEAAMAADFTAPEAGDSAEAAVDVSEHAPEGQAWLRLSLPPNGLDADGDLPVLELRVDQVGLQGVQMCVCEMLPLYTHAWSRLGQSPNRLDADGGLLELRVDYTRLHTIVWISFGPVTDFRCAVVPC